MCWVSNEKHNFQKQIALPTKYKHLSPLNLHPPTLIHCFQRFSSQSLSAFFMRENSLVNKNNPVYLYLYGRKLIGHLEYSRISFLL